MAKKIPLTGKRGGFALVDDENYEWLSKYIWNHTWWGYAARYTTNPKGCVFMHREIMGFPHEIDHINKNRLDNRKSNLRPCTRRLNLTNGKIIVNPTGFGRNVCHGRAGHKPYRVQCHYMNKAISGGSFDNLKEANAAAVALRIKLGYSDPYDLG